MGRRGEAQPCSMPHAFTVQPLRSRCGALHCRVRRTQLMAGAGGWCASFAAPSSPSGLDPQSLLPNRPRQVADRRLYVKREVAYLAGLSCHPCIVSAHEVGGSGKQPMA